MRRSLITLVLFLAAGSSGWAQDWARAMFDHTSHDFGVVARGQKVEHRFSLENIYLEDVSIEAVHSSCTCTTPEVTRKTLKTYEKGEIVAVVDTRKFLGHRESTFRVVFDEPFPAEVQLHCYVSIRSDVVLQPGAVQFDSVPYGTSVPAKKVSISYAGRDDWQILRTETGNPHIVVSLIETGRQLGQVSYDLLVGLKAGAPVGYLRDRVTLVTNDRDEKATHVVVSVEGVVKPTVSAGPSPLMLGLVGVGKEVERALMVRADKPFRILEVSGPNDQFRFKITDEAKTLHVVPVTFAAGGTPGKVAGTIRIKTDVPGAELLEVIVHAQVVDPSS
ncbi:MAG: hypothetical protein A2V98_13360 [Planctomycetes bacterium RBG_16_64_12]|nr:MAG: hypothetical protein A2V98_13360 [Planctomycetes bacterium RBG_16_64_12]